MDENQFELKQSFSARLSPEEATLGTELIREMNPEFNSMTTGRETFNFLISRAASRTKLNSVSKPDDLNKIQELTNENGRNLILIDQKNEEIQNLKSQLQEAKDLLLKSEIDIENLNGAIKNKDLPENSIVLALSAKQKNLLDVTAQRLSERYKQKLDPGKILFHLFWKHYVKEESDPPFAYVLKSSDLNPEKQK